MVILPLGKTLELPDASHATRSPLAEALFRVSGVHSLFFGDNSVTVRRLPSEDWPKLRPAVEAVLTDFFSKSRAVLTPLALSELHSTEDDTAVLPTDDESVQVVKELIATKVRPVMQRDGGDVRYVGMEVDGTVYVMLEGACRRCPSSGKTLKNGIERLLAHYVAEVSEVIEVDQAFARQFRAEHSVSPVNDAVTLDADGLDVRLGDAEMSSAIASLATLVARRTTPLPTERSPPSPPSQSQE